MNTHSKLSPSKAHRWLNCPGSIREEAVYPDSRSDAAVDGTHSHTLLEMSLKVGLRPSNWLDQTLKDHDGEFVVKQDRVDRVEIAFDYVMTILNTIPNAELFVEQRVDPKPWLEHGDVAGTADVIIRTESWMEVIDYKDGMNPVDPVENTQMLLYAMGALKPGELHPDTVKMTIIQPKLKVKKQEPINSWIIETDYLWDKCREFRPLVARTDDPEAPCIAGDWCKYCKHKGACQKFAQQAMDDSGISFSDLTVIEDSGEVDTVDNDRLSQIILAAPKIKQLIEAAEAEALRRIQEGQTIAGLKVVNGRGQRKWAYDDDDMADKLKRMGIPKSHIFVTKIVSPAQVEKLKWEKKVKGEVVAKTLSDRQIKTLENEYVQKTTGKLTVVPESDKRKAIEFNAQEMFSPVVEVPHKEIQEDGLPDWLK